MNSSKAVKEAPKKAGRRAAAMNHAVLSPESTLQWKDQGISGLSNVLVCVTMPTPRRGNGMTFHWNGQVIAKPGRVLPDLVHFGHPRVGRPKALVIMGLLLPILARPGHGGDLQLLGTSACQVGILFDSVFP